MKSKSQEHLKQQANLLSKATFLYSRAALWPQLLLIDQQQIHNVENVQLNQMNQRVIKFDVLRTRGFLFDYKMKQGLEQLLTYYVVQNQISYKQGLHEIAALFIIYLKAGLSLSLIYSMFDEFIKRYMTNFFDDDFQGIQCVLQAYYILLKYHDMELHNCFVKCEFPPQLFAIPWFITLFINKASFEISQMIIENTILINDKYFIFSFNIAVLIKYKKQIIVKGKDNLPSFMSKIYLDKEEQYLDIMKIALKIHTHTPKSFWTSLDDINLFNHHAKPQFFLDELKILQIIQISSHEAIEMIKQHVLKTEIWSIQQLNHPQIKKITKIFQQQIYSPQQPILIFNDLNEELKEKFLLTTLVHIIDLSKQNIFKVIQQLENFKLTNKLWICLMTDLTTEKQCIKNINQFNNSYNKLVRLTPNIYANVIRSSFCNCIVRITDIYIIQIMNPKGFKYQLQIHIEKVYINVNFQCKMQILLKRGNQKIETQQLADFSKGKAFINETLAIMTNIYVINGQYQEKKAQLTVVLVTDKGNKQAGQCNFDLATYLNAYKNGIIFAIHVDINEEFALEKCPDKAAKLFAKLSLTELGEIDFDVMSQASNCTIERPTDKKQSILTPLKVVIESTAKKYFGDSQPSPKIEAQKYDSNSKPVTVSDIQPALTSPKAQQNTQVQIDLQQLYEELNQQKILFMEIKEANNQLKAEVQTEKVKKESLLLQIQELKKQSEKMVEPNMYQEQVFQYESQINKLQAQLRQQQKDNENLTQNYKKIMQKGSKLSEDYNSLFQKAEVQNQEILSLKQRIVEYEEMVKKKDQLYQVLQESNNNSQYRNVNFENQITQLNKSIEQLTLHSNEKDAIILTLKQAINNQQQQIEKYKVEYNNLQNQQTDNINKVNISNIQDQISELQSQSQKGKQNDESENLKETIADLNQKLQALELTCHQQKVNYEQQYQQINQDYCQEMQTQKNKIEQLDSQIKQKQQQIDLNQIAISNQEKQIAEYKERETSLINRVQQLINQTNQLQQVLTDSISQVEVIRKLFPDSEFTPNLTLPNTLIELNRAIRAKFQSLKVQLEEQGVIQNQNQSDFSDTIQNQSTEELEEKNLQLSNFLKEIDNQRSMIKQQQEQNILINNQLAEQKKKNENIIFEYQEKLKKQGEVLELKVNEMQLQLLEKDGLINNLQTKIQEQDSFSQSIELQKQQLELQLNEEQSNFQYLQQQNEIMKNDLQGKITNLIFEKDQLQQQMSLLQTQLIQIEQSRKEEYHSKNEINTNQIQMDQLISSEQQIRKQLESEQQHSLQLESELQKIQSEQQIYQNQLIQLNEIINKQKLQITSLQEEGVKQNNLSNCQLNEQYQLKNQLQQIITQLEQDNHLLNKQIDEQKQIIQKQESQIKELNTQSLEMKEQITKLIQQYQQANQLISTQEESLKQKIVDQLKEKEQFQQSMNQLETQNTVLTQRMAEKEVIIVRNLEQIKLLEIQCGEINEKKVKILELEKKIASLNFTHQKEIEDIDFQNISKVNDLMKQIQQLQLIQTANNNEIIELKKKMEDLESDYSMKEEKHKLEVQFINQNYNNRLKAQEENIQQLQSEIQSYQQNEQEQGNLIKFLESVKENLEQQKSENFEYIQRIQLTNERIIGQNEIQEQQIEKQQLTIKELEDKIQKLETEKVNISSHYQQALTEAQQLNYTQDNSSEIIEKMQDEVINLKCKIGDMFNAALDLGGPSLVDKLQNALGIRE